MNNIVLKNKFVEVNFSSNRIVFKRMSSLDYIYLNNEYSFILYLSIQENTFAFFPDTFDLKMEKIDDTHMVYIYEGKNNTESILLKINYTLEDNILTKEIFVSSISEMRIRRLTSLNGKFSLNVSRGGEGQPIFVDNKMWCGIEFPSANNLIVGSNEVSCTEAPYFDGKEFKSLKVVFGFADSNNVEDSFRNYISKHELKKDKLHIYCDWGLHDEIDSKDAILTEKMTLKNIEDITSVAHKSGTHFDYYLMDAFWFEENTAYKKFKKETFPNGIDEILTKIESHGMKYGLWFDLNMIHAHMKNMEEYSTELGNGSLCLASDKVAKLMEDAFTYHIKEHSVKMLKLDFAYFECKNEKHNHSLNVTESKQKSIANFIRIVNNLRKIEPDLKIICYNGWTTNLDWIGSIKDRTGFAVSPYWAMHVDYIYCGDPRASEIATSNLSYSLCYYTDSMIRYFDDALFPLSSIDDHGTMLGSTPTIYFLNNSLFRLGYLMNAMRGCKKLHLYGDLTHLSDIDYKYVNLVHTIYDKLIDGAYQFKTILGDPRKQEVYGYSASNGTDGYIVVINPKAIKQNANVAIDEFINNNVKIEKVIVDGEIVDEKDSSEVTGSFNISLNGEGYMLIKWSINHSTGVAPLISLVPNENVVLDSLNKNVLQLNFYNEDLTPLRTANGYPEGLIVIEDGKKLVPNMNFNLWSGISWLAFNLKGQSKITVYYLGKNPIYMKYLLLGGKK